MNFKAWALALVLGLIAAACRVASTALLQYVGRYPLPGRYEFSPAALLCYSHLVLAALTVAWNRSLVPTFSRDSLCASLMHCTLMHLTFELMVAMPASTFNLVCSGLLGAPFTPLVAASLLEHLPWRICVLGCCGALLNSCRYPSSRTSFHLVCAGLHASLHALSPLLPYDVSHGASLVASASACLRELRPGLLLVLLTLQSAASCAPGWLPSASAFVVLTWRGFSARWHVFPQFPQELFSTCVLLLAPLAALHLLASRRLPAFLSGDAARNALLAAACLGVLLAFSAPAPEPRSTPLVVQHSTVHADLLGPWAPLAAADLRERVEAPWRRRPEGSISALHAHPGEWRPTNSCATPALWLFAVGHYRTFSEVRRNHLRLLEDSAPGCWFLVVVCPAQITNSRGKQWNDPGFLRSNIRSSTDDAANMLASDAELFGGRLAWLVVERSGGFLTRYSDHMTFAPYWHSAWTVARWAAQVNGVRVSAASVVIRTRPDVYFGHSVNLAPLLRHYASGDVRSLRRSVFHASYETFMMCSFAQYEWGIARPYEANSSLAEQIAFINNLGLDFLKSPRSFFFRDPSAIAARTLSHDTCVCLNVTGGCRLKTCVAEPFQARDVEFGYCRLATHGRYCNVHRPFRVNLHRSLPLQTYRNSRADIID